MGRAVKSEPPASPAVEEPAPVEIKNSVVRINSTQQTWNPWQPWEKNPPRKRRALAAIIGPQRVITTSELAADATYLEFESADGTRFAQAEAQALDEAPAVEPLAAQLLRALVGLGARAVAGAGGRHAALIEDAFKVLIETPGGGISVAGDPRGRAAAKRAVAILAERADAGLDVAAADVRAAIGQARVGESKGATASGRRGPVSPRTAAQARYLDSMNTHPLVFGLGPAGTGKTFLAVAHGAGMLMRGEVDRLVVTDSAVLVVDYKTNRPAPARIEDADPAYLAQMAVYVAVLREGVDPAAAQRQFERFAGFYQGSAVETQPLFAKAA